MNNNEVVLQCQNITKSYFNHQAKEELVVLLDLNLQVRAGESIAIMGRSGSGKTTLLQILGKLDEPTLGKVMIKSHSFIYQMHHLLPEFTALENVAMPLLIAKMAPHKAKERAKELLDQVGLSLRLAHNPAQLSGGERQRVAIARALANNPAVILADEPTGNLDSNTAEQVLELLFAVKNKFNTALIIVTHDINLTKKVDKTMILENGKLC